MRWSIFMLVRTTPAWLALPRDERARIGGEAMAGAVEGTGLRIRHFDAEAFSGSCTDLIVFETEDPVAHYFAVERLRDSVLFTVPYFEVVDIIPAIEDGFRAFEEAESGRARA